MKKLIVLGFLMVNIALASSAFATGETIQCDLADTVFSNKLNERILYCQSYARSYTITFYNVRFPELIAGVSNYGKFNIKCSLANPVGAYLFGGIPERTTNEHFRNEPWFYTTDENHCVLSGNQRLLKKISANTARSVMAIH